MFDPAISAARRDAYMEALAPNATAMVRTLPDRLSNSDSYRVISQHYDLV